MFERSERSDVGEKQNTVNEKRKRECSSVGRASHLHCEGRGFETCHFHNDDSFSLSFFLVPFSLTAERNGFERKE